MTLNYSDHLPPIMECVFRELNAENYDIIHKMYDFQKRSVMEEMCRNAGFDVIKSYDLRSGDFVQKNVDSLLCFFWATTNGVFDLNLVTEERLRSFCDRYNDSQGEVGGIRLRRTEMDFYSVMVAKKSPHS